MLDAELATCVAEETRTSTLMQTARAIVAQIDGAHPSGELQHLGQLQRERGGGREACAEDEEAVRAGDRCPGGAAAVRQRPPPRKARLRFSRSGRVIR